MLPTSLHPLGVPRPLPEPVAGRDTARRGAQGRGEAHPGAGRCVRRSGRRVLSCLLLLRTPHVARPVQLHQQAPVAQPRVRVHLSTSCFPPLPAAQAPTSQGPAASPHPLQTQQSPSPSHRDRAVAAHESARKGNWVVRGFVLQGGWGLYCRVGGAWCYRVIGACVTG